MSGFLLAAEKFWILDPLYAAFGFALAWFYAVIPSFGMAIVLLTVAVSILRMPLVAKQVKSQQEMQRISPELKRIQVKYKNDPQKRNEEMMKLYKEHSVNPFASCLPLLLQMPLFIVLYRMILGLGEARPKHIPRTSSLFEALQKSGGEMQSFGMDLAEAASKVSGFTAILPYLLLIALVVGTGFFQQRQMTARLPKDAQSNQMAVIGKIFPAFLGLISWSIPAGVVLYFFVSNIWQIGQQAVLFRRQEAQKAEEEASRVADKAAKRGKGGNPKELPASDVSDDGADGAGTEVVAGPADGSAGGPGGKKAGQGTGARSGNPPKAGRSGGGKSGAAAGGGGR
ncbi:MAG: YidC/Oxa1 family membrane protein insertase, partial [Actinomycetota bacterium]|nr:YidC/Oxa1 family membrane protein insertase [Actinomycetota bacterium]